ncbi:MULTISPECIES: HepT-like ribonuclease domain-containing protein [Rhodopseudomonas]|uniref:HepT-like ribonuclease domain-containing protein n=1 Tax=Rhodopseudomonas TaxID=1073 RepID=UPI001FCEEA65|nr:MULTISPECIES: DUF86 domain-containing protein [Rhodopseudomonas]
MLWPTRQGSGLRRPCAGRSGRLLRNGSHKTSSRCFDVPPTIPDRLGHIETELRNIRDVLSDRDFADFESDRLVLAGVERFLERISEASRHLPDELKATEPSINWRRLADLGNWLRHAYHATDARLLWEMIQRDLEPLQQFVSRARKESDR